MMILGLSGIEIFGIVAFAIVIAVVFYNIGYKVGYKG
jgi:hypothetical protein